MTQESDFMLQFRDLIERLLHELPDDDGDSPSLRATLSEHLGTAAESLAVVSETVPLHRFVDADIALDEITREDPDARVIGIAGDMRHHMTLGDLLNVGGRSAVHTGQVDYAQLATGPAPEDRRQVVTSGVHLFRVDGRPVVVRVQGANPQFGREVGTLEVLAVERPAADALMERVRSLMDERSVIRGQVITFGFDPYGRGLAGITFVERPDLPAEHVILPEGALDRVSHHVVGIGAQRDHLRAHGQHLKRGILLYGPPGTGKTHTVRHLLSVTAGTTAVLLSGSSLEHIHAAAKIARAHQPAIVVLEDVDLVAEDRSFGMGAKPLLFEVLDALDGLDADADVAFLLTTNRVADLEVALAQRPGRVDLAVEIPLPDEPGRLRLFRLYAAGLFSDSALAAAAARSEGTTASFAKELVRRAVLHAALAGVDPGDEHLEVALDELLSDSESLTRSLLGVSTAGDDEFGEPGAFGDGGASGGGWVAPAPGPMPAVYRGGRGHGWFAYAPRAGGRPPG
jgi:hypothetical protein